MEKLIKIFDLDGCTSDDRWRRKLIPPSTEADRTSPGWATRFDAYHRAALQDAPTNTHEIAEWGGELIVLTGRPVRYAEQTKHWIHTRLGVRPLHILHRNNDDHRPSHLVKRTQVEWLLAHNLGYGVRLDRIAEAIDDMSDIVQMYWDHYRIPARVVRVGEEEHAHG